MHFLGMLALSLPSRSATTLSITLLSLIIRDGGCPLRAAHREPERVRRCRS